MQHGASSGLRVSTPLRAGLPSLLRECSLKFIREYPAVSNQKLLILGDFNAKSSAWGSPNTNARGHALVEWATSLDLRLLNSGDTNTCVRWQGESIVDLSWASPILAQQVSMWEVLEGTETLSDHLYIAIHLRRPGAHTSRNPLRAACTKTRKTRHHPLVGNGQSKE